MVMNAQTDVRSIPGPGGALECALDAPAGPVRGVAVICHPHPQQGGTMNNKVVHTIARALLQLGLQTVRFNFRGVGESGGSWDQGVGEVDDALAVVSAFARPGHLASAGPPPLFVLAGFSFGGFVAAAAAQRLVPTDQPQRLVLVAPSTQKQQVPAVPANTVVVHGDQDDIVPLSATLAWAAPQSLAVSVLPGVGHFFHGQLPWLRSTLVTQLQASPPFSGVAA